METFYLQHPHSLTSTEPPPTVLALGYFDGVHKGHQKVIGEALKKSEQYSAMSAVMTFHPHPKVVLSRKSEEMKHVTPLEHKKELIASLGVDRLYIVEFDREFASLDPQQFVDQYIIDLNTVHVVAGFDYTYGRLGKGTMETLPFHSRQSFDQTTVHKIADGKDKISSTAIRQKIEEGSLLEAKHYLGRPYEIRGVVSHGEKRGRTIGFPTANIKPNGPYQLPARGVYAVKMEISGESYEGVCNVGVKPTFHNQNEIPEVEVHLFDFSGDLYGEHVKLFWFKRLRGEKSFSSVEDLVNQIEKDKGEALQYFQQE